MTKKEAVPSITSSPRLRRLLEDDDLDWENPHHREMYLKEWTGVSRIEADEPAESDLPP